MVNSLSNEKCLQNSECLHAYRLLLYNTYLKSYVNPLWYSVLNIGRLNKNFNLRRDHQKIPTRKKFLRKFQKIPMSR